MSIPSSSAKVLDCPCCDQCRRENDRDYSSFLKLTRKVVEDCEVRAGGSRKMEYSSLFDGGTAGVFADVVEEVEAAGRAGVVLLVCCCLLFCSCSYCC